MLWLHFQQESGFFLDAHLLMPLTSSDAQGWCMLRHQPPSDISCSSLSCSRKLARPSLILSSAELLPLLFFLEFSLPLTSTHWKVEEEAQDSGGKNNTPQFSDLPLVQTA